MRHVEIIAQRRALFELAVEHVLAVVRIGGPIESLFSAVIKTGHTSRGIKKRQREVQTRGVRAAYTHESRLIMIIQKCDQPHLSSRIIVGGNVVVMVLNLLRVAAGAGKNAVDREVERIIEHGFQSKRPASFCPGIGTAFRIRAVQALSKRKEVRFPETPRVIVNERTPGLPKSH